MDSPITRAEHEEFRRHMEAENKRLDDEDKRQNKRLDDIEDELKELMQINKNVERLATNMENMAKTQEEQNTRLSKIENRDGEKWRQVVGYVLTAVLGAVMGLVFTHMGIGG